MLQSSMKDSKKKHHNSFWLSWTAVILLLHISIEYQYIGRGELIEFSRMCPLFSWHCHDNCSREVFFYSLVLCFLSGAILPFLSTCGVPSWGNKNGKWVIVSSRIPPPVSFYMKMSFLLYKFLSKNNKTHKSVKITIQIPQASALAWKFQQICKLFTNLKGLYSTVRWINPAPVKGSIVSPSC